MQITKDELVRELAEMAGQYGRRRKMEYDKLPHHKKLTYTAEAERFIRALNNIRKRKKSNETSTTNIPTI